MDSIEYEALKRAQEMQRGQGSNQSRNQRHNQPPNRNQSSNHSQKESSQSTEPAQKTADTPQPQSFTPVQTLPHQNRSSDLLETLFEDKEKLLILVMILILSGEDSQDPALILALLYLII